jgi:hypothetical protein
MRHVAERRAVRNDPGNERFHQLGSGGDPEQVDRDRIGAVGLQPAERGIADAGLARPSRAGDDDGRSRRQQLRDLGHAVIAI